MLTLTKKYVFIAFVRLENKCYKKECLTDVFSPLTILAEGWQSGHMQRTVNPSTFVYEGSNPSPSTS